MREKICYNYEKLLNLIHGAEIKTISTLKEDEDSAYASMDKYIVFDTNIVSVICYYGLWTSKVIKFADGSKISMKSNNVNSDDKTIIRINNNKLISPKLNISDDYVEATKDLIEWLNNLGITNEQLDSISEKFEVFEIIEYTGVPTPSKFYGSWCYSSEDLKLDEREIKTVLDGIEDEVLREKINCILRARVFKKGY